MGGHVRLMFDGPATSVPMAKAGKVKVFAVTSAQRMPALPTCRPSPSKASLHDAGRLGRPVGRERRAAAVQDRLREAALKALQQPVVRGRLSVLGMHPVRLRLLTSWPSRCASPTTAKARS